MITLEKGICTIRKFQIYLNYKIQTPCPQKSKIKISRYITSPHFYKVKIIIDMIVKMEANKELRNILVYNQMSHNLNPNYHIM